MEKKTEKKEIEIEDKPLTDEDAEAAFLEGTGESTTSPDKSGTNDDDKAGDDTPPDKPGISDDDKAGDDTPPDKPGISDEPPGEKKPTYEALEKALTDTKAWATGLSDQVKSLQTPKPVPAKDTPAETPATVEVPEKVKGFYADYPDAKDAILYEAEQLVKKQFGDLDSADVQKTVASLQDTVSQNNFERAVVVGALAMTW